MRMDNGTPETKPQLYRAGGKLTSVLPGDPSLTLIEAGDPFGLLLADSCFESMMGQRLHLEEVLWVRWGLGVASAGGRSRRRQLGLRSFPRIDIFRHVEGVFVAQDPVSECYLPNPSGEAYSGRLLRKLGFCQSGRTRTWSNSRRQEVTQIAYELSKQDWTLSP